MSKSVLSRLTPLCRSPEFSDDEQHQMFLQLQKMKHARKHRRESERLRNRIAAANLRLVISIARQFVTARNSLEELVSAGMLPLLRAVELFDPSRGYRFSTYATHAVRNFLMRVRKQTARRFSRESNASPEFMESTSPSYTAGDESALIHREECAALQSAIAQLPPREQQLIALRFGLDSGRTSRTFKELANLLGLSRERVRVLTHRALQQLRELLCEQAAVSQHSSQREINHQP